MNRTVTNEETKKLFEFCSEHSAPFYDLQVELVDHLALSIEEQWEKWPELSFESALKIAYEKFGKKGFKNISKTRQKELNKQYTRLHFQFFYRFFRWPQIVLTLLLTYTLFNLIIVTGSIKLFYVIYFTFSFSALVFFYLFWYPRKGRIEVKEDKQFLLLDVLNMRYKQFWIVLFLPLNTMNFVLLDVFHKEDWATLSFEDSKNRLIILIMSFLMVCFGILAYSFSIHASKKIRNHFMEQFPEFLK